MTREEHLDWAKRRALEYVERDEYGEAFTSMVSDLNKHDELRGHPGVELGARLLMNGYLLSHEEMGQFIKGFS